MRLLSLSDTVYYNLGDCYITAVAALDGPCDLAVLLADLEGMLVALPALAERPVRIGLWSAVKYAGPVDLAKHVSIIRDASVTTLDQAIPRLDRLRRCPITGNGPPWRIFALNPGEPGRSSSEPVLLSALYMQFLHGLADAMRGFQILARMGRHQPTDAHQALAARLPLIDLADLADKISVHDIGVSVMQVSRRAMSRDGDMGARLTAVATAAVGDPKLFPNAHPLQGNIGRTQLVRRRGSSNGVGNYLKMITIKTGTASTRRRFRLPGLSRAQDLRLSQWLVGLAPRFVARLAMRVWYLSFDAVATVVPLPRRLRLGGRAVTALFGVPPLWGPVPLVIVALADVDQYHITVLLGHGFTGDRATLLDRLHRMLLGVAAS
jgi:hypothetical protein